MLWVGGPLSEMARATTVRAQAQSLFAQHMVFLFMAVLLGRGRPCAPIGGARSHTQSPQLISVAR
jgi:hypothetical protein